MHASLLACSALPVPGTGAGRHRRISIAPTRVRQGMHLVGRVGSLVSLTALTLLGMAIAAGFAPAGEQQPTITVTYDVQHRR